MIKEELYIDPSISSISIVGIAKNAGKTTALNSLIAELCSKRTLGVVSIGVDGERLDAWSSRPKPSIAVEKGTVIATCKEYLDNKSSAYEILCKTDYCSTLGEIYIAKVRYKTNVKLAGVNKVSSISSILRSFESLGVSLTLVDGAYDRLSITQPGLTDACVLAIGASYSPVYNQLIQRVEELKTHIYLPQYNVKYKDGVDGYIFLREDTKFETKSFKDLMGILLDYEINMSSYLVLPGALTDSMVLNLLNSNLYINLVIKDYSHLFVRHSTYKLYVEKGAAIYVRNTIKLVGIAINPTSPEGYHYPPNKMYRDISTIFPKVPVRNMLGGGDCNYD